MTDDAALSDAVVIGGSAAGWWTAALLARRGRAVKVLERASALRPVPRTLIVTSRLRDVLGQLCEDSILHEINRFEVHANGCVATIPLARPDLVIERSKLIADLAEEARTQGVEVLLGHRFNGFHDNGRSLSVRVQRADSPAIEEQRSRVLIGADGAFSSVGSAAGWGSQCTVTVVQANVRLAKGTPSDTSRVWFRPADTPYFFWLVPDSETSGVLGVIGSHGADIRRRLDDFCSSEGFEPLSYQAARVPVYDGWRAIRQRFAGGDVYLVGDAAGHVKVSTVGGIVTGLRGAEGVAEAITHGRTRALRGIRRELEAHRWIRRGLHHWTQDDYARVIHLLRSSLMRELSTWNRDDAVALARRICIAEPRLLLMGLRTLARPIVP